MNGVTNRKKIFLGGLNGCFYHVLHPYVISSVRKEEFSVNFRILIETITPDELTKKKRKKGDEKTSLEQVFCQSERSHCLQRIS